MDYLYGWKPYVTVAARRRMAERELAKLRKKGHTASPVLIDGRKIASTFWGKAWCENLERYSDFANRLPRGRTYVRNGSVVDLQIARGAVTALVSGASLYRVRIGVTAVSKPRWHGICRDCTGAIDSVVELLQGRLSIRVMTRICERTTGLFPEPRDVSFECSCPDWAGMCKHVAAVLYGVGARLDEWPELLFHLRGVHQEDLIAKADTGLRPSAARGAKVLESGDLSQIFGIEIAGTDAATVAAGRVQAARKKRAVAAAPAAAIPPRAKARSGSGASVAGRMRTSAVSERMKKYWAERRRKRRGAAE